MRIAALAHTQQILLVPYSHLHKHIRYIFTYTEQWMENFDHVLILLAVIHLLRVEICMKAIRFSGIKHLQNRFYLKSNHKPSIVNIHLNEMCDVLLKYSLSTPQTFTKYWFMKKDGGIIWPIFSYDKYKLTFLVEQKNPFSITYYSNS